MSSKKCVLAYSGGLDTSAIVVWLAEQGFEVHAVLVDVGQDEDLPAVRDKALRMGVATSVIADAKPAMFESVIPLAIGLASTYEGSYRLGTALARPFIAMAQVKRAKELGGATLVHGATGKGNDQIRFEFAYRSLAPECPVLAPWKTWDMTGRVDLVNYLKSHGYDDHYEVVKDYSMDENLWHLSIEGGVLEDPTAVVDVEKVLAAVSDKFAISGDGTVGGDTVELTFAQGVPTALHGEAMPLPELIQTLNHQYRNAPWAWDLIVENRFTGIKSRGLYINPAAKVLQLAADSLARSCFHKPLYDQYVEIGNRYGEILYRGEFFSDQRIVVEATARALMSRLSGSVRVQLSPMPYVSRIAAEGAIFCEAMATFEASEFQHSDAQGFINLTWLSSIGRTFSEPQHEDAMEARQRVASDVCTDQWLSAGGLVPSSV